MRKEKFVYNTQTLRYEKVIEPLKIKLLRVLGFVSAATVAAVILISVFMTYFPSPQEEALKRELNQMELKYIAINSRLDDLNKVLDNVKDRDANVHRMMFGMDPIDDAIWNGGIGGHKKYTDITNYKNSGKLLTNTLDRAETLARKLMLQSKSLDSIEMLARDKEAMLSSIPSIKPVREDKLKYNIRALSGFGRRLHPIHKVRKMHSGIDFTAPKGTQIQATGNGKVIKAKTLRSGYGKHVIIDHGFGYQTLYAHMDDILVKVGQTVKKGQEIGFVGNTGTSTAPHLHYEVRYKERPVNPIHYVMDGLSPEEYDKLVDMSHVTNQSFD